MPADWLCSRADFIRAYGKSQDTGCPLPYQVRDKLRGHDSQEVIPAQAGIQEPYIQLQTALSEVFEHIRYSVADRGRQAPWGLSCLCSTRHTGIRFRNLR